MTEAARRWDSALHQLYMVITRRNRHPVHYALNATTTACGILGWQHRRMRVTKNLAAVTCKMCGHALDLDPPPSP